MQIQAINNNLEFGKSKARKAREAAIRQQEDMVLSLSDKDARMLAHEAAKIQTNDRKHQNITNGLIAALPAVIGLQYAVGTRGMSGKQMAQEAMEEAAKFGGKDTSLTTKFFNTVGKNLKGPAARVAAGIAGAAAITGFFAIIDGTVLAKKKAAEHSEGVRNFERKHPGTTMMATLVGAFTAMHFIPKGISALTDKISGKNVVNMQRKLTKFGESFNKNSVVDSLASGCRSIAQNTPSSVKSVGKFALAAAPLAVVVGTLAHAFDHSAKLKKATVENYREVKDLQMDIVNQRRINNEKAKVAMAEKLRNRGN
ncbi:MAG: hypothetical protein NC390_07550 [Fusobacterium sp.]|nr:hypothetical protein [Fusobacterium sp.]